MKHPLLSRFIADPGSLAVLMFALVLAGGCSTVSETGRSQLNFISASEETQLGLQAFNEIRKQTPVSKDAAATARVQQVGQRIAGVVDLPDAQWEFVLFESPEANAFCLPGGKVGIYSGLLPIAKDDAGLATVIGHEVAHATAHHGSERMSQQAAAQLGGQVVGILASGQSQTTQALFGQAYGVVGQVGVLLPYSRKHESEADYLGLLYMARAGYNPEAAGGFWERFAEFTAKQGAGGGTPEFLRTHPLDRTRIAEIKKAMPTAVAEYERAKAAGK
jgi:predicted Zn-dependent protease